jgi:hypothetical protein
VDARAALKETLMPATLAPMVIVLGVPRSGTTLLRVMLDGHPGLFSPPELALAPFQTMRERHDLLKTRFWERGGLRRALIELEGLTVDEAKALEASWIDWSTEQVYAYLQERLGERRLVEKDPRLSASPDALRRLDEIVPEARYVWIVRHPGSVIRSLENMPFAEVMLQGYAKGAPEAWVRGNQTFEDFVATLDPAHWCRIRYEDLVEDPRSAMETVAETIGLPFDEALITPYEGDRMREGPKGARAVGDPNLASRGGIDPGLATKWLKGFDAQRMSKEGREYARRFDYDLDALPVPPIRHNRDALQALFNTAAELEREVSVPMDLDMLEGRRFLLRMLAASADTFIEHADVDRPYFHHAEGETRKMFADCPDTDYLRAPIRLSEGRAYRITGRIPKGTLYVGVLFYGRGGRIGKHLSDTELDLDDEGRFTLRIAASPDANLPGAQQLIGEGDETAVMVRQYFTDRKQQDAIEVSIELEGEAPPPAPLSPEQLTKGFQRAERMLRAIVTRTMQAWRMCTTAALNRMIEIPAEQLFPTPDNRYRVMWYRIGGDQVLFVRGRLPRARYFSLTLYNAFLESLDYRRHTISLNHEQIQVNEDGTFEIMLSNQDHGHRNWLDVAGHRAGYLVARSLLPEGEPPPLEVEIVYERELPRTT